MGVSGGLDAEAEPGKARINCKDSTEVEDHLQEYRARKSAKLEMEALGEICNAVVWREQPDGVEDRAFFDLEQIVQISDTPETVERQTQGDRES